MFNRTIILSLIFTGVLAGCGIKGPPLPPSQEETVQKQKSSETGDEIISADATKATTENKPSQNKKTQKKKQKK